MLKPRRALRYWYAYNFQPVTFSAQHRLMSALVLLVAFFFIPSFSFAQSSTATLSGTVEDQAGAMIAGASITLLNTDQATQRLTTSDTEGKFVFPLVPAGKYSLSVTKEGFAPIDLKEIILNVNDLKSLRISLGVGPVTQTVDVESTSLIDQSASVSTVVDQQFIKNLPLNGRSFQSLIALTPGFVLTKTNNEAQGQFSVNGQRSNANYFMIDGVGANIGVSPGTNVAAANAGTTPGLAATGGTNNLVSVDALEEFKVLTSSFAPEFGRMPGAQVQILTRSGTTEFHGTAFEYFRNDVLDAADWFRNANRLSRTPLRQNDFGGVVGGPLYLPRFGEGGPAFINTKRTFFFFSYEGLRLRLPQINPGAAVPSVNARAIAPPGVRELLLAYPLPNGRDLGNNLAEFKAAYSDPSWLDATSLRIDHHANDKFSFFVRYNHSPSDATSRNGLSQVGHSAFKTQTLTGGVTAILSPALTNDFRANYSRNKGINFFTLDNFGGAIPPPDSLLLTPFGSPETGNAVVAFFSGVSGYQRGLFGVDVQRQINLVDTFSAIEGKHQIKLGVDYRRLIPIFNRPNYSLLIIFNTVTTAITTAKTAFAVNTAYFGPVYPVFNNLSIFAQDTWTVNNRLTLTYGSRWELNPPPTEATGNDPVPLTGLDNPATFALAAPGTPLFKTRYNNFAPRVGLVYQLSQAAGRETVLRGGFGIFYDLGNGPVGSAYSIGFPYFRQKNIGSVSYPFSIADATPPSPFPNPPVGSVGNAFGVVDPDLKLPYTYQWNLSLEQSLGVNQTITASYVAAVGRRLLRHEVINNPNPTFTSVRLTRSSATSDYHALQVQFQRRLAHGLQALGSYTWSHSLDNVSLDTSSEAPSFNIDLSKERGPSDFDVRHAFAGAVTYDIPKMSQNKSVSSLIRNFSLDGIFTARTALPVNVITGTNTIGGSQVSRPDLVAGVPLYLDDPLAPGGWRFNRAAFTVPVGRQGTLGRNALRGFPLWQLDLALKRQFNLAEDVKLQLRAEVFNVFNHPNFGEPVRQLNNTTQFGVATSMLGRSLGTGGVSGGFNPLYQVGGPRSIQLAIKILF